jgi:hypothetical protein
VNADKSQQKNTKNKDQAKTQVISFKTLTSTFARSRCPQHDAHESFGEDQLVLLVQLGLIELIRGWCDGIKT